MDLAMEIATRVVEYSRDYYPQRGISEKKLYLEVEEYITLLQELAEQLPEGEHPDKVWDITLIGYSVYPIYKGILIDFPRACEIYVREVSPPLQADAAHTTYTSLKFGKYITPVSNGNVVSWNGDKK